MSKERALRRAAREAEAQKARVRRERAARRRAFLGRLRPGPSRGRRDGGRRAGRLPSGLSRAQRAGITVGSLVAVTFVWLLVDGLSTRIALTALVALCVPMLFVLTLDRRT
jgi:Flp pilus assembly protein TadB